MLAVSATVATIAPPFMGLHWIKSRLKQLRRDQRDLARFVKRDPAVISRIIKGQQPITDYYVRKFAEFLQVSPAELAGHIFGDDGRTPQAGPELLPLDGYIAAWGEISEQPEGAAPQAAPFLRITAVPAPPGLDNGAVFLVIDSAGLAKYDVGDLVFCRRIALLDEAIGRECVVTLRGGRRLLRFVQPGKSAGRFDLVSRRPDLLSDVELRSAYPVDWIRPAVPGGSRH